MDYKHLKKILEPHEDEFLRELQVNKNLKESLLLVEKFLEAQPAQKEIIYYKLQLSKIRETLQEAINSKQNSLFEPCLVNNYKDDLK